MENFCEDELNQKYNSYFPTKVKTLDDLLRLARIDRSELKKQNCLTEEVTLIENTKKKLTEK